jgi:hypothetical protein
VRPSSSPRLGALMQIDSADGAESSALQGMDPLQQRPVWGLAPVSASKIRRRSRKVPPELARAFLPCWSSCRGREPRDRKDRRKGFHFHRTELFFGILNSNNLTADGATDSVQQSRANNGKLTQSMAPKIAGRGQGLPDCSSLPLRCRASCIATLASSFRSSRLSREQHHSLKTTLPGTPSQIRSM